MPRKNIFEAVKDNYDIKKEIEKIYDNIQEYEMFCRHKKDKFGVDKLICGYKFFEVCDSYLFKHLPEKGTCRDIDEFIEYADADLCFGRKQNLTEDRIINFLEVIENLFFIFFNKFTHFRRRYGLDYYIEEYKETRELMDALEKHMGLSKQEYSDRIILYIGDSKLDQALKNVKEPELAFELIKYKKETATSVEKRMVLKQLDILTEPITDRIKKKYSPANDLDCIYNNFQLRHNNIDKSSNDYIEQVSQLSEKEFCKIYDIAYELVLDTLMLDDYDKNLSREVVQFKTYLK